MIKTLSKATGFTLLEVLIAMCVLAIGLLGLASLQAVSLKNSTDSMRRAMAVNLAYSIVDAMRVNAGSVSNYVGAVEANPTCNSSTSPTATSGTIAQQDLTAWRNNLACTLPQGTGSITVNGRNITVTVQWVANGSTTQQFVMVTSL
jgi:type IV pilus assembly protein PilV